MIGRRSLLVVLTVASGCGPPEVPKTTTEARRVTPTSPDAPGARLDFATANRLPASYDVGREVVRQGRLISYGPVLTTHYALAVDYVDKILKGAKPGDLPVQQPTQFALAINLKTAREIGVTIPQSLLLRADDLIQ